MQQTAKNKKKEKKTKDTAINIQPVTLSQKLAIT